MNTPDSLYSGAGTAPELLLADLARVAELLRLTAHTPEEPLTAMIKLVPGQHPARIPGQSRWSDAPDDSQGWITLNLLPGAAGLRRDPITGMLDASGFLERLSDEWTRAQRLGQQLTLALFEVPDCRPEESRHAESAIRALSSRLWEAANGQDALGRLEPDILALALPGSGHFQALALAESAVDDVCRTLDMLGMPECAPRAGVAAAPPPNDPERAGARASALLERARQALALASRLPDAPVRDRVRLFRSSDPVERETLVLADEKHFLFFGGA